VGPARWFHATRQLFVDAWDTVDVLAHIVDKQECDLDDEHATLT
jgi:hypothetical protein